MRKEHSWAIDAIEESVARVDVDGQGQMHVPQWMLPRGVRKGDVLSVHHDVTSEKSVLTIARDAAATEAASRASRATADTPRHHREPSDGDMRV